MALDDSALSELLAAFRTGDGVDLIRDAVRLVLQELIELEATEVIGAKPYERTEARVNERNGHRPRVLSTQAGDIELKIPKLSHGSFFPSLLEPGAASIRHYTRGSCRPTSRGSRPARSMIWSKRWGSIRGSQNRRSLGSARGSTCRSTRSATGR